MRSILLSMATVLATLSVAGSAIAEDIAHLQRLLSSRQCPACQLQGAGLVHANLAGADLQGADLTGANLSQANLAGANLAGANLTGAMLQGANLSGANLSGANLWGTDLRSAYLYQANFENTDVSGTYIEGAIGIPDTAANFQDYYRWGIESGQRGNFSQALDYFNETIVRKPDFAAAYLARAVARYRLTIDAPGAIADSTRAAVLFEQQGYVQGAAAAKQFAEEVKAIEEAAAREPRARGNLGGLIQGLGTLLLRFLL